MSLIGTLNIGRTSLAAQQAALQVTGNNIANAGNASYTRQVARLTPGQDVRSGANFWVGSGVNLNGIQRQVDESLLARIRASVSDQRGAATTQEWLARVESVYNALSGQDLSSRMSAFFGAWSGLANNPSDSSLRQIVLQNGQGLASQVQQLRGQLDRLRGDANDRYESLVAQANTLAGQVATLNQQIAQAEGAGGGQANALRDQRDEILRQLSELIDIQTVPTDNGVVNVYVGSEPLVFNGESRGVTLRSEPAGDRVELSLRFTASGGEMRVGSGQFAALSAVRGEIDASIDELDRLAGALIFELNKLHASGQGLSGLASAEGLYAVADPDAALNSAEAGLAFAPSHGSFVVQVRNKTTGQVTSTLIQVDLDGQGTDATLNSLTASLDAIDNLSASVVNGRLRLSGDSSNIEISFAQDSSGALAALGVNTFFSGSDASDIAVSDAVRGNLALIAAGRNGRPGDNQNALAIAALETAALGSLGGSTLRATYEAGINRVAGVAATARGNADASDAVLQTLEAQREALSGVSLDEEAVNLIRQQRAFQGAARLIAVTDELMQTVLSLVR